MKKGYSLIELIVTVGLTSILVIAITSIAMTSLIGSSRIRNLIKTRQAGDSAITQMQSKIRNSKKVVSCNSPTDTLTIENQDGQTTAYALEQSGGLGQIASNSGIFITPNDTTITSFNLECSPNDYDPSIITIQFSITNAVAGSRSIETPTIPFQTSVYIRNK